MIRALLKKLPVGEVLLVVILRAVPGLVNLSALILLASWMPLADYGILSTTIATIAMLGLLICSPIGQTITAHYAQLEAEGCSRDYMSEIVLIGLGVGAVALVLGLGVWLAGFAPMAAILAIPLVSIHYLLQEFMRAQSRNFAYAAGAMAQATTNLALVFLVFRGEATVDGALTIFATSYLIGAGVCFLLLGMPLPRLSRLPITREHTRAGVNITGMMLAENALTLGMRYVIAAFGPPQLLGVFSFCLDMAQRTVGFFVNAATHNAAPKAYRLVAQGRASEFGPTLVRSGAVAVAMSASACAAILSAFWLGAEWLPADAFAASTFVIICSAVVANRCIKLLAVPYSVRLSSTGSVAIFYAIGAVFALVLAWLGLAAGVHMAESWAYLLGYIVVIGLSALHFAPKAASLA